MVINGDVLAPNFISSFGGQKFSHIIADPPWKYNDRNVIGQDGNATRFGFGMANHYEGIDTETLCNLPIGELAEDRCHLYLWATAPMLPDAMGVLFSWGFSYSTVIFVWVKCNKEVYRRAVGSVLQPTLIGDNPVGQFLDGLMVFGPGFYTGSNIELVLLGTKGKPFKHVDGIKHSQLIFAPLLHNEHSRKPDDVHHRVDEMYPDGHRLELFARRTPPSGWWAFGNEVV